MSSFPRRLFLSASAALPALLSARNREPVYSGGHASDFELHEYTVTQLREAYRRKELTVEQVVRTYLHRIHSLDASGPHLNSVIELNPDALNIARELDGQTSRGSLHGVPILLKDNIDTADRMQTTAGSLALVGKAPIHDAPLVTRLRAAGAVILGKTNLSEWANFRSTHSTSGWSARGGQTRNPYVLDRNPCGSSSGSGAAISANMAMLAVGTETDGSVVCPSSMCGIVGIKPTLGAVSQAGIIPIARSQDTAGPMARSVHDAALLLGVLVDQPTDFVSPLKDATLRGVRLGIMRQYFNIGPAVHRKLDECIHAMQAAGAVIVDGADIETYEHWRESETEVLLYEFKAGLNRYLAARGANVRSLADVIEFNKQHRDRQMPYFEQELMEQAQGKGPLAEKDYTKAVESNRKLARKQGLDATFKKYKVDALIGPTAGPAWLTDWALGDRADSGCASPPAVAGYPHVTVPAGQVYGLPIGMSFIGPAWSEAKLLQYAYAFEQLRKARVPPRFRPTADFAEA